MEFYFRSAWPVKYILHILCIIPMQTTIGVSVEFNRLFKKVKLVEQAAQLKALTDEQFIEILLKKLYNLDNFKRK